MSIKGALRMGHMKYCDQGTSGIKNEYDVIREYAPYTLAYLTRAGVAMTDVTPAGATSSIDSLGQGVNKANYIGADFFVSCHADGYNGNAYGSEVIYCPGSSRGKVLAESIEREIEALGFPAHKGAYADERGLYELKHTNMAAVIVEPLFVDSHSDMAIYNRVGPQALGEAIGRGIAKWLVLAQPTAVKYTPAAPTIQSSNRTNSVVKELQTLCNNHGRKDKNGNSLIVDGAVGPLTLSALPVITRGSSLTDFVVVVQRLLSVTADGSYGKAPYHQTYDAVINYQKAKGLTQDGVIGPKTWAALLGA